MYRDYDFVKRLTLSGDIDALLNEPFGFAERAVNLRLGQIVIQFKSRRTMRTRAASDRFVVHLEHDACAEPIPGSDPHVSHRSDAEWGQR